jgi:conjugative relaxase-like TrwC/TraI family protein
MEYLSAHAGYSRVHNPDTGEKDLVRLPGLVAVAYQHETSRCGDPHLHTHVIVPNRQARADGQLASLDGTSLYHEARAAGVIYQATLRSELHRSLGFEWAPVDPSTGMAEIAGVERVNSAGSGQNLQHFQGDSGSRSRRGRGALVSTTAMGGTQPHRRGRAANRGVVGGRAKSDASGQTRRARVDSTHGAVAR